MSKIHVPSNIYLTRNARKDIERIEANHNFDPLVDTINEYLIFISETPTDIMGARNRGWTIEKMNSKKKKDFVVSIRITRGDRFTYSVIDGEVTLLGTLGHYVGTDYANVAAPEDFFRKFANQFEDKLDNDEAVDSFNTLYNKPVMSVNLFNEAQMNNNISSSNELVNELLKSEDFSTSNVGFFMYQIERLCPKYFNHALDTLMNNISKDSDGIKYIAGPFDVFTQRSAVIVLTKLLNNESTASIGATLLQKIINCESNRDFEFYGYCSYLNRYKKDPDQTKLGELLKILCTYYENPATKEEALDNMRKLVMLIESEGLKVQNGDASYYNPYTKTISINKILYTNSSILHEFGHAIDETYNLRDRNVRPNDVFEKAKSNIINNPNSLELFEELNNRLNEITISVNTMYNNAMIEKFGSIENAFRMIEEKIESKLEKGTLKKFLIKHDIGSDVAESMLKDLESGRMALRDLATLIYNIEQEEFCENYLRLKDETSFMDIIDAIFNGEIISINGKTIQLMYGHGEEYYKRDPDNSMSEIMANLNSLIVTGREDLINLLKDAIGEEAFNYLMAVRNQGRIIKTENVKKELKAS